MPSATILVNGTPGSNDALPINALVQLNNQNTGGEVSYLWELLDQPDGAADALSATTLQNPTLTPRKEGSYLLRLTVNLGLPSQAISTAVAAIRHLRTNERAPAAFEVFEVDAARGWKTAADRWLNRLNVAATDANVVACALPSSGVPALGDVVAFAGVGLIKSGLPGQEILPLVQVAPATSAPTMRSQHLGVVVGTPTGAPPAANGVALVRRVGLLELPYAGSPSVGDLVFVSDANRPSLSPGTNSRVIGKVVAVSGGNYQVFADGSTFGLSRIDQMAAIAEGKIVSNWTTNLAGGYVVSSGAGDLLVPLRVRQGERFTNLTYSRFGDGAVNLTTSIVVMPAAGGVSNIFSSTSLAVPSGWNDVVINSVAFPVNPGDALYVDFSASAANLRIGTVRATFMLTP